MGAESRSDDRFEAWVSALDDRYLANLTPSEAARALRALSSCYVERRSKLVQGAALGTAGKRAAFGLFYAPIHFLTARRIVAELPIAPNRITHIHDLGCGTGAAGAAWALEAGARISGIDRHPWVVAEANWTYRQLGIEGRAAQGDLARARIEPSSRAGVIAAYAINELDDAARGHVLQRLLRAHAGGASVVIIEPIARRLTPWWRTWEAAFIEAGGRTDEWRVPALLPRRQRELARAAGLNPRELTARSLFAGRPW